MTKRKSTSSKTAQTDIAIIGSGPAGLSLAAALADSGLRVTLVEQQPRESLAQAQPDGRDIALTHSSMMLLEKYGIRHHMATEDISPIREARVVNGTSPYALKFQPPKDLADDQSALGYFVPNHIIRRAAYKNILGKKNIGLIDKTEVTAMQFNPSEGILTLSGGRELSAKVVIGADGRFSKSRQRLGIQTSMLDFGRSVIVCRMSHALPHHQVAQECFFYDKTVAVLPVNGNNASLVITLSNSEAERCLKMADFSFNKWAEEALGGKLGKMKLEGKRHSYPLVAVYARQFVAPRFALLGDAAVGMHPVTAHGYNFGLHGAHTLADSICHAWGLGLDIGSHSVLEKYQRDHHKVTALMYHGTNALVKVYTDDRPAMRLVRDMGLRIANHLPPFKAFVSRQLRGEVA